MKSPYVRRLRLGQELRKLRLDAGLTAEELARSLRVTRVKITHIETAARRPDVGDVMNLLETLNVTGERYDDLVRLARDGAERGWWEERRYKLMGDRQALAANIEAGATRIREYSPTFIPGLLQTEEYIRAANATLPEQVQTTWSAEGATRGRLERQRIFRRDDGPTLDIVAETTAVGRLTGPRDVMRRQLTRLLECLADPRVSFRVLPLHVELIQRPLPSSPFFLYNYPDPRDPTVALMEPLHSTIVLSHAEDVEPYEQLWGRLSELAMSEEDTAEYLNEELRWLSADKK